MSSAARSSDRTEVLVATHVRYAKDREPLARDELVGAYEGMVRAVARRYTGRQESYEDLVQVAYIGLLKALDRFDPELGYPFAGFAVPTMIGELKRHFRDRRWKVRLPRPVQERYLAVRAERDRLTQELGRPPTVLDIAEALDLTADEVIEATDVGCTFSMASLDGAESGEDPRRATAVPAEMGYEALEDSLFLQGLVDRLGDRERQVLALRFQAEMTQRQVGARLGMGQMQVSRLLGRTLTSLRAMARAELAEH